MLVVVLLGLIAYSNALLNEFVWDDVSSVQFNKFITNPRYVPAAFKSEFHYFGRGQGNFYRPFLTLSFMLDYAFWKLNPIGYHLTNVLMHIGVALLIFFLVKNVIGGHAAPLVTSVLFVAHPIYTQAVTYVSGRGDMLTCLFMLASFLLYWHISQPPVGKRPVKPNPRQNLYVIGAALFFMAALLSKETAIIYPFLVLAAFLVFRERRNRQARITVVSLFICLIIYVWLRTTALKFGVAQPVPPFEKRLPLALQAFATYIRLLFVPVGLHMERTIDRVAPVAVVFTLACLIGACVFIVKLRKARPGLTFALLWFLIAWIPISGLYPLNAPIAEHWLYFPSMGFLALLAGGCDEAMVRWSGRLSVKSARGVFTGIFAVVLLCFIALTIRRNGDWRDNLTLYTKTLEKAPNSARVHYNLGVIYDERGENEKALREFMETLRLDPSNMYVRLDLAAMFAQMGALKETVRLYKEAISLSPNDPEIVEAYVNLGRIYYDSGNRDEAIRLWQKALQLKPDIQIVRRWLAEAGAGS